MRILVVEDEAKVASFIRRGLAEEGYAVDVFRDGLEALGAALSADYDLILLDLILPGLDGWDVLARYRREGGAAPVLVLTARDRVEDKVKGLDAGADDYLTKPFAFAELLARVRALLRRRAERTPVLKWMDLELDPSTRRVRRSGKPIDLSPREFALLEFFMRRPGRVLSRAAILEHVWEYSFDPETNVVEVYVNYLRNKVDRGFDTPLIHTVRGAGYRFGGEG